MAEGSNFRYLDILPTPNVSIDQSGFGSDIPEIGQSYGQPYSSIDLSQSFEDTSEKTLSGKYISKRVSYPKWAVNIKYNPMTKASFMPVYAFILQSGGSLKPFWVQLPQYINPKNSLFATFAANPSNIIETINNVTAGARSMEIVAGAWGLDDYSVSGLPSPGDMFNIQDLDNSLHTKAYMITSVETANNNITPPTPGTIRIHFSPGLQRNVNFFVPVKFSSPAIKMKLARDIVEYKLDSEDLYEFNLSLIEAIY